MATPPQDLAVEASLLGGVLMSADLMTEIDDQISASDFFDPRHVKIFQAVADLHADNRSIDILTVANLLKQQKALKLVGGQDYLQQLIGDVPTVSNIKDYAQIVLAKSRRRGLIQVGSEVSKMGQDESQEVGQILEAAEKRLFEISDRNLPIRVQALEQLLADKFKRLEQLSENQDQLRGIPTGFCRSRLKS